MMMKLILFNNSTSHSHIFLELLPFLYQRTWGLLGLIMVSILLPPPSSSGGDGRDEKEDGQESELKEDVILFINQI